MEPKLVEELLEKYFKGTTSIVEEKQIKTYFSSKGVATHLVKYQTLFRYFEIQKQTKFDKKILLQSRKQNNVKWIGIASSFLVLFGLAAFYFYKSVPNDQNLGSFNSPEEAFLATQKALVLVSKEINIGIESVAYLQEYEKTKKTIFK